MRKTNKIEIKCAICRKPKKIFPCRAGLIKYCSKKCGKIGKSQIMSKRIGPLASTWKGGRFKNSHGYWVRTFSGLTSKQLYFAKRMIKGPYILEHRLLMAVKLNRPLKKYEIVHHKNGIKEDNKPSNLQLLTESTHSYGNLGVKKVCPKCGYKFGKK